MTASLAKPKEEDEDVAIIPANSSLPKIAVESDL
jgi:hypothetical protein